jgi:hypothetical protein
VVGRLHELVDAAAVRFHRLVVLFRECEIAVDAGLEPVLLALQRALVDFVDLRDRHQVIAVELLHALGARVERVQRDGAHDRQRRRENPEVQIHSCLDTQSSHTGAFVRSFVGVIDAPAAE